MKRLPKLEEIQSLEDAQALVAQLHAEAVELVRAAQSFGMTLTIGTSPRKPLAMGNYDMVIEIRPNRDMYRS